MDNMESKMSAILNNPEMMQKIMTMAQSLNETQNESETSAPEATQDSIEAEPSLNLSAEALQKLASFAGNSHIDKNQQTLLRALNPYLNSDRISKLEKAMRSAKMATIASSFLGNSGLLFHSSR